MPWEIATRYSDSAKRGCPTCDGNAPKTCLHCRGKSRLCDWYRTELGWAHMSELTDDERITLQSKGYHV